LGEVDRLMNIGSDKVCVGPERLIIHAAEPMDLPTRGLCSLGGVAANRQPGTRARRSPNGVH